MTNIGVSVPEEGMGIEQAIFAILGDEAGHAIIADMGVHWAIVAAMAAATTADDPNAIAAIRKWTAAPVQGHSS